MKPLTIEELKALPVGDWVWVVVTDEDELTLDRSAYYKTIKPQTQDEMRYFMFSHDNIKRDGLLYSTYGTTWLAYKNKEQAEALDGYTVPELVVALNNEHNAFISEYERSQGHRLKAGEFLASKNLLDKAIELLIQDVMSNTVDMEELSCNKCPKAEDVCISGDCTRHWKDYYLKKAEARLKELRGEK